MKHILVALLSFFTAVHSPSSIKVVDKVGNSLIRVTGHKQVQSLFGEFEANYTCSGWAIDTNKYMTAAHCYGRDIKGDGFKAQVLKVDKVNDLMLLKVDNLNRPALKLRSKKAERGESVYGIGYGYAFTQYLFTTHKVLLVDYSPSKPDDEVQLTAGLWLGGPVIGGMSGGPFVDTHGEVVGMVQRGSEAVGYGVGTIIMRAFLVGTDDATGSFDGSETSYPIWFSLPNGLR